MPCSQRSSREPDETQGEKPGGARRSISHFILRGLPEGFGSMAVRLVIQVKNSRSFLRLRVNDLAASASSKENAAVSLG